MPGGPNYRPSKSDSFYRPEHGSGWVIGIDWSDRTVLVAWADKSPPTEYSFDDVEDKYKDAYGGIWVPDF